MNKLVVVTGIPGVGKSTVITGTLKELEKSKLSCKLINYGDVMLEMVCERTGITDRDEMRKLPADLYREIQRAAAERIAKAKEKLILLDTHCSVKKPEGYFPGLPRWVLEHLWPEVIVLIEATPEEVAKRRTRDVAMRRREEELLSEAEEHQQLNRAIAMGYAALTGAAVKIIRNEEGELNKAVREMIKILR